MRSKDTPLSPVPTSSFSQHSREPHTTESHMSSGTLWAQSCPTTTRRAHRRSVRYRRGAIPSSGYSNIRSGVHGRSEAFGFSMSRKTRLFLALNLQKPLWICSRRGVRPGLIRGTCCAPRTRRSYPGASSSSEYATFPSFLRPAYLIFL